MKELALYLTRSTLKREYAIGVTFWWAVTGTILMFRLPITQFAPDAALIAWQGITPYVFSYATLAFGADFVAKQTNYAGPPANTETTVKTEVTDTTAVVTTSSEPKP